MKKVWNGQTNGKRVARDYSRRYYGNPLFMSSKRRQKAPAGRFGRGAFLRLLGIAALAGIVWYAIWSPAFRITKVEITGATPATEKVLRTLIETRFDKTSLGVFPQAHVFFFDSAAALADIKDRFFLEQIDIKKKLPGTLQVDIKEKEVRAALTTASGFRALDGSGYVVRDLYDDELSALGDLPPGVAAVPVRGLGATEVPVPTAVSAAPNGQPGADEPKNLMPLIIDSSGKARKPGESVFSPATIALVLQAFVRLPDVAGDRIRWFEIDESAETVNVLMAGGDWKVMLSTAVPFDVQAEHLGLVLKEKIATKRSDIEYVDLRYNEKIFYRLKGAAEAAPQIPAKATPSAAAAPPTKPSQP